MIATSQMAMISNPISALFRYFSSQLVLTSTTFYKIYHLGTEMAHVSRCAVKPY